MADAKKEQKRKKQKNQTSKINSGKDSVNIGGNAENSSIITGNRNKVESNKYGLSVSANIYGLAQGDQARTEVNVAAPTTFSNQTLITPDLPPSPVLPLNHEEQIIIGEEPRWVPTSLVLSVAHSHIYESVGLLRVGGKSYGTAWLLAPHIVITNYHVICNSTSGQINLNTNTEGLHRNARNSLLHFDYFDEGAAKDTYRIARLVQYSKFLDYAVLALDTDDIERKQQLEKRRPLILNLKFSANPGESLNIVQHPEGKAQKVAFRENTFLGFVKEPELNNREVRLRYKTDTKPGSSGSPVCDNNWQVVGLHYKGGEGEANQGTLMSIILEDLNEDLRSLIKSSSEQ